jgi:uncharacterized protein
MITRVEIEQKIKEYKPVLLERFGVDKIGLFGSYIHGLETEDSDIDLIVEFCKPIGWEFIDLKEFLEEILGKKVDLVTKGALKPQLKGEILKEVVYQ